MKSINLAVRRKHRGPSHHHNVRKRSIVCQHTSKTIVGNQNVQLKVSNTDYTPTFVVQTMSVRIVLTEEMCFIAITNL